MQKMFLNRIPKVTISLVAATVVMSLWANFDISGTLSGKIRATDLEAYGGLTWEHLKAFELWRLIASQLIHVKQIHMLYNMLSLLALGILLENYVGSRKFFIVWFISGSVGTLVSTFTIPAPWNLGTGGSQAIFGIVALGGVIYLLGLNRSKILVWVLALSFIPALLLDLIHAYHPKLGHVAGLILGALISYAYFRRSTVPNHAVSKKQS